eukprot:TRINITY_DN9704_c0_g1_i1.p1 TRINITY_DN9704_c0_g1~~TRINITY_DN9704_c0_g1_i1.p1  ORF type:complete len:219 (+),score=55.56 TRINITY_DN9704_c0_g1_i1:91-747(+)
MGCPASKRTVSTPVKVAEPMSPGSDYKIHLQREADGEALGLTLVAMSDNTLRVLAVKKDGLVPAWNGKSGKPPQVHVKAGDFIVSVNRCFGDMENMKQQLRENKIMISLKRGPVEEKAAELNNAGTVAALAASESAADADAEEGNLEVTAVVTPRDEGEPPMASVPPSRSLEMPTIAEGSAEGQYADNSCESAAVREEEETCVRDEADQKFCAAWLCF